MRRFGASGRVGQAVQGGEHALQLAEQATALRTLRDVALHPGAPCRYELRVQIRRHVARRPAMVDSEPCPVDEPTHADSDLHQRRSGSHVCPVGEMALTSDEQDFTVRGQLTGGVRCSSSFARPGVFLS